MIYLSKLVMFQFTNWQKIKQVKSRYLCMIMTYLFFKNFLYNSIGRWLIPVVGWPRPPRGDLGATRQVQRLASHWENRHDAGGVHSAVSWWKFGGDDLVEGMMGMTHPGFAWYPICWLKPQHILGYIYIMWVKQVKTIPQITINS